MVALVLTPKETLRMARIQTMALDRSWGVSNISEVRTQRRSILELRAQSGTVAAAVEIPTPLTGAKVRLRQTVWTAAELRRLVRVLTRAAEKLDS
jgi:hypothetical protein